MVARAQQTQYERAAAIAKRDALTVVAHGTVKAAGSAVYAVPSRTLANTWHLVAATRARLELEAQVRRDVREREAERALHAAARELAQIQQAERRETADLARSNAPISVFK
jgi:hypothetical protein